MDRSAPPPDAARGGARRGDAPRPHSARRSRVSQKPRSSAWRLRADAVPESLFRDVRPSLARPMGCRHRIRGELPVGGKRPPRGLEFPLLPLCACGAGHPGSAAGGDSVAAAGPRQGRAGPHPAAAF
ncbi:hypothetical protein J1605_004675 [Eschrichtius robustus]|uniref:Uncharacterized protein n=1 Tax=Eschrichtius robustus TaxID=9764 RepID=A0AB34HDU3_ESCRO|nr:hypothetical protein J1605_004675 [Eschrichtius robustus]